MIRSKREGQAEDVSRFGFFAKWKVKSKPALLACMLSIFCMAGELLAKPIFMVSGRWDNTYIMVDLEKAIDPANDGTENAVVNRLRYTPDAPEGGLMGGQGINVVIPPGSRYAYAGDHGRMSKEQLEAFNRGERIQHGFEGYIVAFDLSKVLDPANNMTLDAVDEFIPSGGYGATGLAVTPDGKYLFIAHAEEKDSEDGGRLINIMDLSTREIVGQVEMAYGDPGFPCPPATMPVGAPDPNFGCFPDTNGMVLSPIGGGYLFTGNGGTKDVSVIDVQRALAGDPGAEFFRVPVDTGPFGVGISPDGRYVATANRECQQTGEEGSTISIIDVEKAIAKDENAEVARVVVGTDDPAFPSRPFAPAFFDGGKKILVTNFRTNNMSVVDVEKAIRGDGDAEIARIPFVNPNGKASRPRGIALTKDGKYAAITGGVPKDGPGSSVLFILDLETLEVKGRVTGVGNEAYFLAVLPDPNITIDAPVHGGTYQYQSAVPLSFNVDDLGLGLYSAPVVCLDDASCEEVALDAEGNGTGSLSGLSPGVHTLSIFAESKAGKTTQESTFNVNVSFGQWLPPISLNKVQKSGSTLPVKFTIIGQEGPIDIAAPTVNGHPAKLHYDKGSPFYQYNVKVGPPPTMEIVVEAPEMKTETMTIFVK